MPRPGTHSNESTNTGTVNTSRSSTDARGALLRQRNHTCALASRFARAVAAGARPSCAAAPPSKLTAWPPPPSRRRGRARSQGAARLTTRRRRRDRRSATADASAAPPAPSRGADAGGPATTPRWRPRPTNGVGGDARRRRAALFDHAYRRCGRRCRCRRRRLRRRLLHVHGGLRLLLRRRLPAGGTASPVADSHFPPVSYRALARREVAISPVVRRSAHGPWARAG